MKCTCIIINGARAVSPVCPLHRGTPWVESNAVTNPTQPRRRGEFICLTCGMDHELEDCGRHDIDCCANGCCKDLLPKPIREPSKQSSPYINFLGENVRYNKSRAADGRLLPRRKRRNNARRKRQNRGPAKT